LTAAREVVFLNNISAEPFWVQGFIDAYPNTRLTFVNVANDASAQGVADSIRSSVADTAAIDTIVMYGTPGPWCENVPAARTLLGSDAQLELMEVCAFSKRGRELSATSEGLAEFDGAYAISNGIHPNDDRGLGLNVYEAVVARDLTGGPYYDNAWNAFETLFTFAKIANEMDPTLELTSVNLRAAIHNFDGASILQFGPMACGRIDPGPMPSSGTAGCAQYAGVFRFVDGKWVAIADGRNGKLLGYQGIVDVDPNLFPKVE
jgi:hypothetical protein